MPSNIYSTTKALYHPDRLAAIKRGELPAPVHAEIVLIDTCNQDCSFCLDGDTPIVTNSNPNLVKPIKDLRVGDSVLTIPDSKGNIYRRVIKIFKRRVQGKKMLHLKFLMVEGETIELFITGEHPIRTLEGFWISAKDLQVGDLVEAVDFPTYQTPSYALVSSISHCRNIASPWVYNLAVEGEEVYYANRILVHNCAYRMSGYSSNQLFQIEPGTSRKARNPDRRIEYDKAIEIIDDLVAMGVKALQWTGGGEPTIHPHFAAIAHYAQICDLETSLVTNGSMLLNPELRAVVRGMIWTRISVDAATPELYCRTRGVGRGMWDRVVQGIKTLTAEIKRSNNPLTIGIGFVATPESWQEIYEAVALYKTWGVQNVRLGLMFNPDGSRPYDPFRRELEDLAEQATGDFDEGENGFRVVNRISEKLHELDAGHPDFRFCSYQFFTTYICPLGVFRCCITAYNRIGFLGSLEDRRFVDLWNDPETKKKLYSFNATQCERCQFTEIIKHTNAYLFQSTHTQKIGGDVPAHVNFV